MTTFVEVQRAYTAFRTRYGVKAAQQMLTPFGGQKALHDEELRDEIISALENFDGKSASVRPMRASADDFDGDDFDDDDDAEEVVTPKGRQKLTPQEQAKRWKQIARKAWSRFNNPPRRREDGL